MSKETILKTVNKCIENQKTKKTEKTRKSRNKKTEKPKKKRPINWNAIEKNIEKYDGLSKKGKNIADKNWGRTIPFWKKALRYHNQGLSNSKAIKKAKEN